jgi:hypothetical protein
MARYELYLIQESKITDYIRFIKNMSWKAAKLYFQTSLKKFIEHIKDNGMEKPALVIINKHLKTKFNSLDQILTLKVNESSQLDEGLGDLFKEIKTELFPTLAFYPALTCWLEIDSLITTGSADFKKLGFYAIFWILLISGRFVSKHLKNKGQELSPVYA